MIYVQHGATGLMNLKANTVSLVFYRNGMINIHFHPFPETFLSLHQKLTLQSEAKKNKKQNNNLM